MRLLSDPRPDYVEQCLDCRSTFLKFGTGNSVSHNDLYQMTAEYHEFLDATNLSSESRRFENTLDRLEGMLSDVQSPSLFDVGAGAGNFLNIARMRGFRVAGNEISRPAADVCRERHGIELSLGDDLEALGHSAEFDAVTMWCVIAHADDPALLLSGARSLLRPGGILYLTTPRYCFIDRVALLLRRLSADRYRSMFDRRINAAHRRQYSRRGMEALLRREGFNQIEVTPKVYYGLHTAAHLQAIGLPNRIARDLGSFLDLCAKAGLLPRNALEVFARA